MQFYLLYLHLLIQSSFTFALHCTSSCSLITLSFTHPFFLPEYCQNFTRALVCLIDYRIDYDAKQIYINFKATNDTDIIPTNIPSQVLIQSIWLGFNEQANQPNITHRRYGCNNQHDCARRFYFQTIERLMNDGWKILERIQLDLYNSSMNDKLRCRNNRTTIVCPHGLCYALNIEKKHTCTSDQTATLFSEIVYHTPRNRSNERHLIEYKCNQFFCNGQRMMEKISQDLLDYTHGVKSASSMYSDSIYRWIVVYFFIRYLINDM